MTIGPLTREDVELVRQWRNMDRGFLRTPYYLTEEMQQDFYDSVICDRMSAHRYYALRHDESLIGMGGLTTIEWENGLAEISLIIDPDRRGHGLGRRAVDFILDEGFCNMRLRTIWGMVYTCGPVGFWKRCIEDDGGHWIEIPWVLKRWEGQDHSGIMFAFTEEVE